MSKVKPKKQTDRVKTNGQSKQTYKKKKHKKNTGFFDTKTAKKMKTEKPKAANPIGKPPTDAQEYSSNWRKLLQVRGFEFTMVKSPYDTIRRVFCIH